MELDLVVWRKCQATSPNGDLINTTVGLTRPVLKTNGDWDITISLGLLEFQTLIFNGVDSWHAMQMGSFILYTHLHALEKSGWILKWFDGEESDLKSLLPFDGRNPQSF